MKHIRWVALALLIGVVAVAGVWASLNLNNTPAETTSTDTPASDEQTASNATLGTNSQPDSNTDAPQQEDNNTNNSSSGPGPRVDATNDSESSNDGNNTSNNGDEIEISIGRGSWETDKDVPPFLVMKTIFEDWLDQEDREEYNLFEMDIYVNNELTRFLAVGKIFENDVEKIPNQLKPQLNPWVKAEYTGDFGEYRVYELE